MKITQIALALLLCGGLFAAARSADAQMQPLPGVSPGPFITPIPIATPLQLVTPPPLVTTRPSVSPSPTAFTPYAGTSATPKPL